MGQPHWPASFGNPSEQEILEILKRIKILIRIKRREEDRKSRLFVLDLSDVDIYRTNIASQAEMKWHPEEVTGLKVRFAYQAKIRAGGGYAGFFDCRIEDIFGNLGVRDMLKGTYIEVMTDHLRVDHDDQLGRIWRAIIIVYDKEVIK